MKFFLIIFCLFTFTSIEVFAGNDSEKIGLLHATNLGRLYMQATKTIALSEQLSLSANDKKLFEKDLEKARLLKMSFPEMSSQGLLVIFRNNSKKALLTGLFLKNS